jgi:NAD(P)-dependent dehydrogenase (short-subunit alcohol dehydrogenase family)
LNETQTGACDIDLPASSSMPERTPAGRRGAAEDMATIVALLAPDDSSCVSGHALVADGGYLVA